MGHELTAGAYKVNDLIAEQVRLNGRNAVTVYAFQRIQCLDELKESFFTFFTTFKAFPEIAQVHTGEHDLAHAIGGQFPGLFYYFLHAVAAAFTAGHGNGAESAGIIASVLYFQEGTGTVVYGIRGMESIYIFDIAGADLCSIALGKRFKMFGDIEFFCRSQHQVNSFYIGNFFWL